MCGRAAWVVLVAACSGGRAVDATMAIDAAIPDAPIADAFEPGPPTFPNACPQEACAPTVTMTTAAQLITFFDANTTWPTVTLVSEGCVGATTDVRIEGRVTVRFADLRLFPTCDADCKSRSYFVLDAPGVRCLDGEPDSYCLDGITLEDTTVRFRPYLSYGPGLSRAFVVVLPPCSSACRAEQVACEANGTCWDDFQDHCRYCLGGPWELCECWDGERLAADGTSCRYWVSPDFGMSGKCLSGSCTLLIDARTF